MPIPAFEKLSEREQQIYIAALVQRARDVLCDEEQFDLADKVQSLFEYKEPEDRVTLGVAEVEISIDLMGREDAFKAKHEVEYVPRDVEEAMFATLKKNHIDLPERFFTVPHRPKSQRPWRQTQLDY
jgi:hypothetical protein